MRPDSVVIRPYLLRGLFLWIVTRVAITGVILLAGGNAIEFSTAASVEVVILIVALGWVETLRLRERALLGNLGVSPLVLSSFFAGPALLGELALRIAGAALA